MDRTFRGFTAGFIGAILMNIWSYFSFYILNFTDIRYVDWSSIMIFGYKANSLAHLFIAQMSQLIWTGFLGVFVAFAFTLMTSRGFIFKGALFGFMASFIIYCVPALFKMNALRNVTLGTAVTDIVGGIIWGVTTVIILKYLDSREVLY